MEITKSQRYCQVFKSGGTSINGHNLPPLVGIGSTELLNAGVAKAPTAPPLAAALDHKKSWSKFEITKQKKISIFQKLACKWQRL